MHPKHQITVHISSKYLLESKIEALRQDMLNRV